MSIRGGAGNGGGAGGAGMGGPTSLASIGNSRVANAASGNLRRDSNWTNSTEGYGSMRSEQSVQSSRRCSELSAMSQTSNVSTRAMMNSPTCWDPISVDHHSHNSRRSSLNQQMGAGGPSQQSNATMSHHLDRLRKKSHNIQQQQQANCQQQPQMQQQPAMGQNNSSGRMSAMSECSMPGSASQMPMSYGMPPPPQASSGGGGGNQQHTVRRASDPVRALDRNFGVTGAPGASNGGHTQRRGSYNQMTNTQQQQQQQQMQGGRMPLHGQKIRGTSGDFQGMQHMQPINQVKTLQDFKTDSV